MSKEKEQHKEEQHKGNEEHKNEGYGRSHGGCCGSSESHNNSYEDSSTSQSTNHMAGRREERAEVVQFETLPWEKIAMWLLVGAVLLAVINTVQVSGLVGSIATASLTIPSSEINNANIATSTQQSQQLNSQPNSQQSASIITFSEVAPKGIPLIYGAELGVNYDDVSATNVKKAESTIKTLGLLDDKIVLTGDDLKRYITIGSKMSCEYCCGAESIIFKNGQAACGCAHSYAMRGIAKYLIKNHGAEFTDDQISEEVGKWKTLFFPGPMAQKAGVLKQKGIEFNYINLASNKYRGIEKDVQAVKSAQTVQSASQQVGGC